ncbi:hypothetical protein [Rhizobium ruizarguesonis]|uniref:hypothetical protein n=1 Tax=Rhizobium ruizarguesonis TaxID=2081791 RepID=UPI001031A081|nr:hypothetical protein [Rhizobium ruizarguesonis]TBA24732.1 hypothetical protein ELH61_02470 [Rhizobium ruizarguesonis]
MKRSDYFVLRNEDTIDDLRRHTNRLLSKIDAMGPSERNLARPGLILAIHIEGQYTVAIFQDYDELTASYGKLDPDKSTVGWIRLSEISPVTNFAEAARMLRGSRWQRMIRLGFETKAIPCGESRAA